MDCKTIVIKILSVFLLSATLSAQSARERSVEVSATISESPARFDFSWPADLGAMGYQVFRKDLEAMDWGAAIASLPGDAIGFFDEDLVRNQDDEINFRLIKAGYKIYLSEYQTV